MKRVRVGQIGIGHNHGAEKMRTLRKFSELFEIVGYAEENEKWVEKRGSHPAYYGLTRLSVDEVIARSDLVFIESDVWDLTKYAKICVDAGKHIHMDKPAGGTLEEYKYVLNTAKDKGLIVQLGYMYRYNPAVKKCLEHIKNGDLGKIYSVNAEMSSYHSPEYRGWLSNFNGGIMYILGSHLVDLIVYIMGEPDRVSSFLKMTGEGGVNAHDNNLAVLEYGSALARIYVSSLEVNGWGRRQLMVSGSRGTVNICPLENPTVMTYSDINMIGAEHYHDVKEVIPVENDLGCRYDEMLTDLYAYVKGHKENPYTYEHEYLVQRVLSEIIGGVTVNGKNID